MEVLSSIEALRAALAGARAEGGRLGFVPTMGYLHAGQMELVSRARAENEVRQSASVRPDRGSQSISA